MGGFQGLGDSYHHPEKYKNSMSYEKYYIKQYHIHMMKFMNIIYQLILVRFVIKISVWVVNKRIWIIVIQQVYLGGCYVPVVIQMIIG